MCPTYRQLRGTDADAAKHAAAAVWHTHKAVLAATAPPLSAADVHGGAEAALRNYAHLLIWASLYPPPSARACRFDLCRAVMLPLRCPLSAGVTTPIFAVIFTMHMPRAIPHMKHSHSACRLSFRVAQ